MATSSVHVRTRSHHARIQQRIDKSRERLRTETVYLGENYHDVQKRLRWYVTTMGNVVIETAKAFGQHMGASMSTSPDGSFEPEPAMLSAIVVLTREDFWLSSDGDWEEPTSKAPTLADVKITCTGAALPHEDLSTEFATVIDNIDELIKRAHTTSYVMEHFRVLSAMTLDPKVMFRHRIFEVHVPYLNCKITTDNVSRG